MIVVGCTTVAYRMTAKDRDPDEARMYWAAWMHNAEYVQASMPDEEVRYFAALEVDARGLVPFAPFIERLQAIGGEFWTFSLDDGVTVLGTADRLRRIVMGHNLVGQYAVDKQASHCLFLASDTSARDDVLPRLLELKAPVAASHISTYGLGVNDPRVPCREEWHTPECNWRREENGQVVDCVCGAGRWDVRSHMETCACMLLRRDVFTRIKWRVDPDRNLTDDPSMHADITELLGDQVLSRHDVQAVHWPQQIPAIEHRHSEEERTVIR